MVTQQLFSALPLGARIASVFMQHLSTGEGTHDKELLEPVFWGSRDLIIGGGIYMWYPWKENFADNLRLASARVEEVTSFFLSRRQAQSQGVPSKHRNAG